MCTAVAVAQGGGDGRTSVVFTAQKAALFFCKKTTNEKCESERGVSGGMRVVEERANTYMG